MSFLPEPKYKSEFRGAVPALLPDSEAAFVDFRLERMNPDGLLAKLKALVAGILIKLILWYGQHFAPWLKIGRWLIVTRHKDVEDALKRSDEFNTPFNPEMTALAGGATFMLGLDGQEHLRQRKFVQNWLSENNHKVLEVFTRDCREASDALLKAAPGEIDVMQDYFTRVSSEASVRLLGLPIDDPEAFGAWTIALSAMVFGDPTGSPVVRELASHAAWQMRGQVDRAILQQSDWNLPSTGLIGACLDHRAALPKGERAWSNAEIRALVMGVAIGLVPTVTLMAGNILSWLLEHPSVMRQAQEAAKKNEQETLRAILLEVGRLRPALWPGQFRLLNKEVVLPNGQKLGPNQVVLVATASALRDPRQFKNPNQFSLGRPLDGDEINLTFGMEPHACLGRQLAIAQLVEMFGNLLRQKNLTPAPGKEGRLVRVQAFPRHLTLRFKNPDRPGKHAMEMVIAPLLPSSDPKTVRERIEALGNPAGEALASALSGAKGIHFLSLNLVDLGNEGAPDHVLLMELNADGERSEALEQIDTAAEELLGPIFAAAGWAENTSLREFFEDRIRSTSRMPFGLTGLDYNGTDGFSLADKVEQRDLARFAANALDWVQRGRFGKGGRPLARLEAIRAIIRGDELALEFILQESETGGQNLTRASALRNELKDLIEEGKRFRSMLFMPSGRRLPFVEYLAQPRGRQFMRFLRSKDARPMWLVGLLLVVVSAVLLSAVLVGTGAIWILRVAAAVMIGTILSLVIASITGVILFYKLRAAEQSDRPDDRDADPAHVKALVEREDAPGFQQNHVLSMSQFKPGWLRRLSFAFAMWGIGVYCRWLARPGFILSMGTIHFARWYRLPGRSGAKLMFHSNYDGNWESYLEDFVMKAHIGQTAAWSHGEGFPRSESLVFRGAEDGPRFKRWTRRQQHVTQCWWSATPGLSLDRMRVNALIHEGLARAASDSVAREWLALFGSQQRPQATIESEEVQTIIFRGMGNHKWGLTAGIMLPPDPFAAKDAFRRLTKQQDNATPDLPPISFGERPWGGSKKDPVGSIALSAAGLVLLGVSESPDGLSGFPFSFRQGMRARWRQLADPNGNEWEIDDTAHILVHYLFNSAEEADKALSALVGNFGPGDGGKICFSQISGPTKHPETGKESIQFEPFGFRDGVSQPVIRGTLAETFAKPDDLLEPGEFILGYRTQQGQVAPGPKVGRQADIRDQLPDITVELDQAWPAFRRKQLEATPWRDLGRNGSYLVLRQFRQRVPDFKTFCDNAAADLSLNYPGLSTVVGTEITGDWVAGKLVGRWQDGIGLSRRPHPPKPETGGYIEKPDTQIRFGREDARGQGCPLGAHVRRANPRDSLAPDAPDSISVSNRHRIIRRGRAWHRDGQSGLTFLALCADIERQFEFIQSQWLAAPSFHGLADEVDPLVLGSTSFSIPTSAGPLRLKIPDSYVQLAGGGYFFLPSRSALQFLAAKKLEPEVSG
ncbi:Cytochrome P450 [Caulobacteraceae bacterium]